MFGASSLVFQFVFVWKVDFSGQAYWRLKPVFQKQDGQRREAVKEPEYFWHLVSGFWHLSADLEN
jgi:hypothetical protein